MPTNTPYLIDTSGLSCPQPVPEVKNAMDEGVAPPLHVVVDNECSRENVTRFARHKGWQVTEQPGEEGRTTLVLEK